MRKTTVGPRRAVSIAVVIAVMTLVLGVGYAKPVSAAPKCPTTAAMPACPNYTWPYEHSWYITDVSSTGPCGGGETAMQCLADQDATQANYVCANNPSATVYMTVLNFGRPGYSGGSAGIFSVFIGNQSNSQVQTYVQQYAQEWYNKTTSCPRLYLVIGTGNDYQCVNDSGCSVYTAGQQWDALAHNVETYLSNQGYSWQETAWPGDDIEAGWDPWASSGCPKTQDFVNGMANQESGYSSHLNMVDYGDAWWGSSSGTCSGTEWTQQNIYDAAWAIGWDVPLPETYGNGQTSRWTTVYDAQSGVNATAGTMLFYGNMTECTEGDQLPTGTCYNGKSSNGSTVYANGNNADECGPELGYNNLSKDISGSFYSSSYSTNIQYQNAALTPNTSVANVVCS